MRWWHHMVAAGSLALLYGSPTLNIIGGIAFGAGMAWWGLGRYYDHSLKAWWHGDVFQS